VRATDVKVHACKCAGNDDGTSPNRNSALHRLDLPPLF
jgi:hypothetical protein